MDFDQQYGLVVEELTQQGPLVPGQGYCSHDQERSLLETLREVYLGVEDGKTFEYSMKIPLI